MTRKASCRYGSQAAYFATWLWAGWLWLRGKWLYAVAAVLIIVGVGLAVDRAMKAGQDGGDWSRAFLNRTIKPE